MDRYIVTIDYGMDPKLETEDLVAATRFAVACALHTSKRFAVHRVNSLGVGESTVTLFSVNPISYDYRRVTPDTALAMKAMAHELVSNIDIVVPEIPMEGPTR